MGLEKILTEGTKFASSDLDSDIKTMYPFNCAPIDILMGGGIPSGRVVEVYGKESHGKSTFALESAIAFLDYHKEIKSDDCAVLWIESESVFDKARAKWMGIDLSKVIVCEANTTEGGFKIMGDTLTKCVAHKVRLFIIWDTIGAASTEPELTDNEFSQGQQYKPRLIRKELRRITPLLGKTDSAIMFVNQGYQSNEMGSPFISSGGGGIKYHASVRIEITRRSDIVDVSNGGMEQSVGINTQILTRKNKLTLPKQKCILAMYGETGIDKLETTVNYLKINKIISLAGSWATVTFNGKDYKFQTIKKLRGIIEVQEPLIADYLEYLVYLHSCSMSPLIKVRLIHKVWSYEMKFFKTHKTLLSDKEKSVAKVLYDKIQKDGGDK